MNERTYSQTEFLITLLANMLKDGQHVVVGNTSPIPAAAALLARTKSNNELEVTILGSTKYNRHFTGGIRELYDFTSAGRVDFHFFGGAQIDGSGNINLVGVGGYPKSKTRFTGSFGSGLQFYMGLKTILFREEHSTRVLVPKVDFISAPGVTPPNVYRLGGPVALVTSKAIMNFDRDLCRFELKSTHPGVSVEEVVKNTGFEFSYGESTPETLGPTAQELDLIRGEVRQEISEVYPRFAEKVLGNAA